MSLQLLSLGFDANDPLRLAGFWANALGWTVHTKTSGRVELVPTDGTRFRIAFSQATGEKGQGENRLHLDLTSRSSDDQTETIETLLALGSCHVDIGQRPDEPHVVLADPEGNEFCVIEPDNSFLAGCNRLGSITCDGSRKVGHFWSEALGWPLVWDQDEETVIRDPDGAGLFITWGPPAPPKVTKNRLYLEIAPPSKEDLPAEIERLISLGATYSSVGDGKNVAMLDPDGNEFYVTMLI